MKQKNSRWKIVLLIAACAGTAYFAFVVGDIDRLVAPSRGDVTAAGQSQPVPPARDVNAVLVPSAPAGDNAAQTWSASTRTATAADTAVAAAAQGSGPALQPAYQSPEPPRNLPQLLEDPDPAVRQAAVNLLPDH